LSQEKPLLAGNGDIGDKGINPGTYHFVKPNVDVFPIERQMEPNGAPRTLTGYAQ